MPRGNDTEGNAIADAAMRNQYGIYGNADEMIRANQARLDPAVQKASLLGINEEKTAELRDEGGLSGVAGKFDLAEGEEVQDFAVRGNALVAVVQDAKGNLRKVVTGFTDDYKEPELTAEQSALRAQAQADAQVATETARLREEAAAKVAEAQAAADQEVAEALVKIREDAQAKVVEAQEAAQAEAESDSGDAPKATATRSRAKSESS